MAVSFPNFVKIRPCIPKTKSWMWTLYLPWSMSKMCFHHFQTNVTISSAAQILRIHQPQKICWRENSIHPLLVWLPNIIITICCPYFTYKKQISHKLWYFWVFGQCSFLVFYLLVIFSPPFSVGPLGFQRNSCILEGQNSIIENLIYPQKLMKPHLIRFHESQYVSKV